MCRESCGPVNCKGKVCNDYQRRVTTKAAGNNLIYAWDESGCIVVLRNVRGSFLD